MASSSTVLVIEPHMSGHRGPYLEWMVEGLVGSALDVLVVTLPDSSEHPSVSALRRRAAPGGEVRLVSGPVPANFRSFLQSAKTADLVRREVSYWRLFKSWYRWGSRLVCPKVVFVPYLDYCLYSIGLFGSPFGKTPWVGVAMRPSFHYSALGITAPEPAFAGIKKALFFRLLRSKQLKRLLTIDEPLMEFLKSTNVARKVDFLPEPAEFIDMPSTEEAREQLGLPLDRQLVLVYGRITKRKGVVELLNAMVDPSFPVTTDVLLAGKITQEVKDVLAAPSIRVLEQQRRVMRLDRFIEAGEEKLLFAAANVIWLGYRGHYTASGVLVQACAAGRPVIACEEGILGWQTRRHNLGRVVSPTDTMGVIDAVRELVEQVPDRDRDQAVAIGGSFARAQEAIVHALVGIE